jgi:hypothetical protein
LTFEFRLRHFADFADWWRCIFGQRHFADWSEGSSYNRITGTKAYAGCTPRQFISVVVTNPTQAAYVQFASGNNTKLLGFSYPWHKIRNCKKSPIKSEIPSNIAIPLTFTMARTKQTERNPAAAAGSTLAAKAAAAANDEALYGFFDGQLGPTGDTGRAIVPPPPPPPPGASESPPASPAGAERRTVSMDSLSLYRKVSTDCLTFFSISGPPRKPNTVPQSKKAGKPRGNKAGTAASNSR